MRKIIELLVYPLIVGLIVAVVVFGLPFLTAKEKKLEYTIEEPVAYLDPNQVGDLNIKINGIETKNLNSYNIKLHNTGDVPVKELAVQYRFSNQQEGFQILTDFHRTIPPVEFGEIKLLEEDSLVLRYEYALYNPSDETELTILTTKRAELQVYSKQEGLTFSETKKEVNKKYFEYVTIGLAVLGAFLSMFINLLIDDKKVSKVIRQLINPGNKPGPNN